MSQKIDLSILIVHTFEKRLIRQTLRSIRRAAPRLEFEIIIIDNNPPAGMKTMLSSEFPRAMHIPMEKNVGFGAAMNAGAEVSSGRYILVFNPDIVVSPNSLESLVKFMDENSDIGICGPKLLNPDGSLQLSCYGLPNILLPMYRRTPIGKMSFGKKAVDEYLMVGEDHSVQMDVDSLIGAALVVRRELMEEIGLFDERYFMYYEDNDLCRRCWGAGKRVVYYPRAQMLHYHRRASADGGLLKQLLNRFTWIHISSAVKYFFKYRKKENPRISL